jgi:hypothetical protein
MTPREAVALHRLDDLGSLALETRGGGQFRDDPLKPDRVARMAREMQGYFSERVQDTQARAKQKRLASWKN